MCFSATSSFVASGVLFGIGVLTIAKTKSKSHLMFAMTPIGFAIQQAVEGIQWLTIYKPEYYFLNKIATYIFVSLVMLWTIWIPISLLIAEKKSFRDKFFKIFSLWKIVLDIWRKRILLFLGVWGIILTAYAIDLMLQYPVSSEVINHSILYNIAFNNYFIEKLSLIFYVIPTVVPFFISSLKRAWILGLATSIALIITYFFMQIVLISIWCFFTAILSILIYFIIQGQKN